MALSEGDIDALTVKALRAHLSQMGLSSRGLKAELQERLRAGLRESSTANDTPPTLSEDGAKGEDEGPGNEGRAGKRVRGNGRVKAGRASAPKSPVPDQHAHESSGDEFGDMLDSVLEAMASHADAGAATGERPDGPGGAQEAQEATEDAEEGGNATAELGVGLSSSLVSSLDQQDYFVRDDAKRYTLSGEGRRVEGLGRSVLAGGFEKGTVAPPATASGLERLRAKQKKQAPDTAGRKWFDLPATPITPEVMQDLKILQLRGVLDRKKHFKAADSKSLPKYFQVGHVVEGAADHYSGGVTSKKKKRRLVDELLDDAEFRRYNKKKFVELSQNRRSKGRNRKSGKQKKSKVAQPF